MRRRVASVLWVMVLGVCTVFSVSSTAPTATMYSIAAGSMGGNMYRQMAAISKVLNEDMKDVQFTVRTGSPTESVLLIEKGELFLGATCPHNYVDVHPEDPRIEKTRIRMIWPLHASLRYLIVPEASPYQTMDQLRGKRMAVGIRTGEGADFIRLVKAIGWTEADMKNFQYIGKNEGIEAYREGSVEAFACWTTVPSPIFMELAASKRGARLIPLSAAEVKKVQQLYPFWTETVIPAGSHEKIKSDAATITTWYHVVCRDDFPADVSYRMAKIMDVRIKDIVAGFAGAREATAQNAAKHAFFKIHPGTEKYLKEKGVLK